MLVPIMVPQQIMCLQFCGFKSNSGQHDLIQVNWTEAIKVIIKQDWNGGCISAYLLMADVCVFIVVKRHSDMRSFTSWAAWNDLYLQQTTAELLVSRGEWGEECRNIFSVSCWTPNLGAGSVRVITPASNEWKICHTLEINWGEY